MYGRGNGFFAAKERRFFLARRGFRSRQASTSAKDELGLTAAAGLGPKVMGRQ